jgi:uncharacterized membrane protein
VTLRCIRERVVQALAYEIGGLLLATPIYSHFAKASATESFGLLLALSLVNICWCPIHNTTFDLFEFRLTGRLASDRPPSWRLVHAISHEASSTIVTLPIIIIIAGLGFWQALLADVGLTALYATYAYLFHFVFDLWRPVRVSGDAKTKPIGSRRNEDGERAFVLQARYGASARD